MEAQVSTEASSATVAAALTGHSATTRAVLTGDALQQARVKVALDSVKLALQDWKQQLQDSAKVAVDVASLRGDLAGLGEVWQQQALESSTKLAQTLEEALDSHLAPILAELRTTTSSLSSSLTTTIGDSTDRLSILLQTYFSTLSAAQAATTTAVLTLDSRLPAELAKVTSALRAELEKGAVDNSRVLGKVEQVVRDVGTVLVRQQEMTDALSAARKDSAEVEQLKARLERVEKDRQEDRKAFTEELATLSATLAILAPLAVCIPQLTTLLQATKTSTAPSFDSSAAPSSTQPVATADAGRHLGDGSRISNKSTGAFQESINMNADSRSSSTESRRTLSSLSKSHSPPQRAPRHGVPTTATTPSTSLPSSSAPVKFSSDLARSHATPPEENSSAELGDETEGKVACQTLSPPFGPSTQVLIHQSSPSVNSQTHAAAVAPAPAHAAAVVKSSSAPARLLGRKGRRGSSSGSHGSQSRRKRMLIEQQSSDLDDEEASKEEPHGDPELLGGGQAAGAPDEQTIGESPRKRRRSSEVARLRALEHAEEGQPAPRGGSGDEASDDEPDTL